MSNQRQVSLLPAIGSIRKYLQRKKTPPNEPILLKPANPQAETTEEPGSATNLPSGNGDDVTTETSHEEYISVFRPIKLFDIFLLLSIGGIIGSVGTKIYLESNNQDQSKNLPSFQKDLFSDPVPKKPNNNAPHDFGLFDDPFPFSGIPWEQLPQKKIENQGFDVNALDPEKIKNREKEHKTITETNDLIRRVPLIAAYAKPAVVFINPGLGNNIEYGTATGWIYSSDDSGSLIVTNRHVVEIPYSSQIANHIKITLINGKETEGKVIGSDKDSDLALIKINEKNLPTLKLSENEPRDAEFVMALGNPQLLGWTTTLGIISGTNRTLKDTNLHLKTRVIQTDAPLNPGNSGGPLLDLNGEVVAVNVAIIRGFEYQNLGFGIPAKTVKETIKKLTRDKH